MAAVDGLRVAVDRLVGLDLDTVGGDDVIGLLEAHECQARRVAAVGVAVIDTIDRRGLHAVDWSLFGQDHGPTPLEAQQRRGGRSGQDRQGPYMICPRPKRRGARVGSGRVRSTGWLESMPTVGCVMRWWRSRTIS